MILPTKRISYDRALLTIGAVILRMLDEPKTISRLWDEFKQSQISRFDSPIKFDWFVLSLDLLFMLDAIEYSRGKIRLVSNPHQKRETDSVLV